MWFEHIFCLFILAEIFTANFFNSLKYVFKKFGVTDNFIGF